MNTRDWNAIEEGQALPREQGVREAVFDAQFMGSDRTVITGDLENTLPQQGQRD